jgi:dUTP pyrophosphatase
MSHFTPVIAAIYCEKILSSTASLAGPSQTTCHTFGQSERTLMKVKLLHPAAKAPTRGSSQAAGLDLCAVEQLFIWPGERKVVSTGLSIEIPPGFYGQIAPRSGLAVKSGIMTMAGVIDSDYRGEIKVVLYNADETTKFEVSPGDRIAQLILLATPAFPIEVVTELSDTVRADGGFGSTGVT